MTPLATAPTVLIRAARDSDGDALHRLAALDSQALPAGPMLVAEQDGELVAALCGELLDLLELRARRRSPRPRERRRRLRLAAA